MNQPTAQFYRVITDDRFPYRIYGAQQDNTTVAIASRSRGTGIDGPTGTRSAAGESGWIAPKPKRPRRRLRRLLRRTRSRATTTGPGRRARSWRGPQLAIGPGGPRSEVPLPVERPDPALAARPEHALPRRAGPSAQPRTRGRRWEEISSGPDAQRQDQAGVVRRADHEGQHRHRVYDDDLHGRGVAARDGRASGPERTTGSCS